MKEAFINKNFRPETIGLIAEASNIVDDYTHQGYTLSLRQLYYQLVSKNIIENTMRSYKRLISIVRDARLAGFLDWDAIEDRTRNISDFSFNESQTLAMRGLEYGIRFDYWGRQETYIEVWVEKDALQQVISKACRKYDIPHMACKGYLSSSASYRAGKRFDRALDHGERCVLIHLGDHDPSGIDMTRDNDDRIHTFARRSAGEVDVRRIALNMNQIEEYSPPPNFAKETDSRAKDYIKKYGDESWELDALEPTILNDLITNEIEKFIDWDIWNETMQEEKEAREPLIAIRENWFEVKAIIQDRFL